MGSNHAEIMKNLKFALLLTSLIIQASCYKSSEDFSPSDLDVVVTAHNEDFNFNDANTFVLPDSVVRITGDGKASDNGDGEFDEQILERVRQNMLNLGYTEEPDPENNPADLVITVQTLTVDNYIITSPYLFWNYWGWYPWFPGYGYGPGYGWGYPYPVLVDSYNSGTVLINMFDPEDVNSDNEIQMLWLGALNGLLDGSISQIEERINEGIDRAFEQSPYL